MHPNMMQHPTLFNFGFIKHFIILFVEAFSFIFVFLGKLHVKKILGIITSKNRSKIIIV